MARTPLWLRRLFRQQRFEQPDETLGADLGFTGPASKLAITDDHRAAAIESADTADARLIASMGYLRKVLKNGSRAARDRGDQALNDLLDESRETLAELAVVLAERLKTEIAARGYDDDGPAPAGGGLSGELSISSAFQPFGDR